jgi:CheY-like chemotaxis protein
MRQRATRVRCRTLIVEDDGQNRDVLARLLGALGHESETARTLEEATAKMTRWKPNCVLLDLVLPDGNGIALLKQIREGGSRVRVAVITGEDDPVLLSEVEALQPGLLLQKPINVADLMHWLRRGESATVR